VSRETVSDRELARLLDEQIEAMRGMLSSLEAERQALLARDGEALLRAVDGKAACVAGADTIEDRRQALLDQLGISAARTGRSREFSADAGIAQRWQQVLALTKQCRALNDANGHLIRGQRRRVEGKLRILRGEPAAAPEYGPAGEHRAGGFARALASY